MNIRLSFTTSLKKVKSQKAFDLPLFLSMERNDLVNVMQSRQASPFKEKEVQKS